MEKEDPFDMQNLKNAIENLTDNTMKSKNEKILM